MEDNNRNLILATVLSFLVILVWYTVFAPEPVSDQPSGQPLTEQVVGDQPLATPGTGAATTAPADLAAEPDAAEPAGRVAIQSSALSGSISLAGGRIDDLLLTRYQETRDEGSPDVRLLTPSSATADDSIPVDSAQYKPYYAVYGWTPGPGVDASLVPNPATVWTLESGETLSPGQPVTLAWDNGAGQIFRRTFALDDNYLFTVGQSLQNNGDAAFSAAPYGIIARHGRPDTQNNFILHEGVVGMVDGTLVEMKYDDVAELDPIDREGRAEVYNVTGNGWIGFTDKYWMSSLAPAPGQAFTAVVKYADGADIYQTEARFPMQTVEPGTQLSADSYLFAGAKVWEVIRGYEETPGIQRFVDSIDWGWFYFLTKPIFQLLHWLHGIIGNMGWAIIALTFVLKTLVFPLARKSYISMAKMKELQPQMEEIKNRTGDDRMKFQKEVMELYKREKVNPAAGCLPILLQIPIFFSLYKVIFVTIELRHAPWFGWIQDLSAPDPSSLLNLYGLLPYGVPAQGTLLHSVTLPALAIALGISMWMQQRLNPAPTDAAQKMIFAWMPWIFMFMLGGFASGLVLYWITNNVITILQQYTIMSMHGHRPDLFGNIKSSMPTRKRPGNKPGAGK
ncbi:MAG: membrane protein insertase YidC [Paracoccus sp. (in: a-proteobacteria)]|jgi:YidC/Oxa1 family membrane protein insertase|uniref:membrane protein insertase YidC n=1 Tax=Paracoccus TaxID=265 RepID=UPI0011E7725F|nr:membrane protein insertase YidC [Paracoccus sp. 08]MCO6364831.1 membrane protein insertase YidC [Paracoccus sp. 08]TYP66670.1 protein translocase subunit yidC [Stutzerimonas stutzeri]